MLVVISLFAISKLSAGVVASSALHDGRSLSTDYPTCAACGGSNTVQSGTACECCSDGTTGSATYQLGYGSWTNADDKFRARILASDGSPRNSATCDFRTASSASDCGGDGCDTTHGCSATAGYSSGTGVFCFVYECTTPATGSSDCQFDLTLDSTFGPVVAFSPPPCPPLATTTTVSTADASIREGSASSTGNWGEVEVYGKSGAAIVGLVRFDTSQYAGQPIREAMLRIYVVYVKTSGDEFAVFDATVNDWEEGSVTWNNYGDGAASSRGSKIGSLTVASTGQYYEIDVTAHVSGLAQSAAAQVTFWIDDESRTSLKIEFESRRDDKSNPPQLRVTTGCDDPPPASPPAIPSPPPLPPTPPPLVPPPARPPTTPAPASPPPPPPIPPTTPPPPTSPQLCPDDLPPDAILGQYFDITAASSGGAWVSGRLNPRANRNWRAEPLDLWSFTLLDTAGGRFQVINERDTEERLFGGLRVAAGKSSGSAGEVHELVAELRQSSTLVGCLAFSVHVLDQTAMSVMRSRVHDYAVTESHMWGREEPSDSSIESMVSYIENNNGKLPGG